MSSPLDFLEWFGEQKEERSWIEISAAIRGADFNTLLELIHLGMVKQRQIGEHLYYSINKKEYEICRQNK